MGAIGYKRGGGSRYVFDNVVTGQSFVLPAGFKVAEVITKKLGITASNFTIGTTVGGVDVVGSIALGGTANVFASQTIVPKGYLSKTADTTLYIGVSAANTADVVIFIQKIT